ncbi:MAG: pentapeptide repeat-containing protein [Rhodoluna sp.]
MSSIKKLVALASLVFLTLTSASLTAWPASAAPFPVHPSSNAGKEYTFTVGSLVMANFQCETSGTETIEGTNYLQGNIPTGTTWDTATGSLSGIASEVGDFVFGKWQCLYNDGTPRQITGGGDLLTTIRIIAREDCDIKSNDVSYCDFSGRDFFNAGFNNKNMSYTSLVGMTSRFSYWDTTDLSHADLTDATLYYAHMRNANFTNADLTDADLTYTNLNGADFTGANLTGVVSGSIMGNPSVLPTGWKVELGYLVGPGANLTDADLTGANLDGVDLTGAVLKGVKSGRITGEPILPEGWFLNAGYLIGPGADLSYRNLNGVTVWFADFTDVNLTGSSVDGAAFIYAKSFAGVRSGGMTGSFHYGVPPLVNGYIIAPGVNLEGANLQGADLDNLDLTSANLRGADLTGASLIGTKLNACNLVNVDLTDTDLTNADFRGATIRNVRFSGATMTQANFSETDVYNSEFYGTKFQLTDFMFSNFVDTRSMYVSGSILGTGTIEVTDGVIYSRFVDSFVPRVDGVPMLGNLLTVATALPLPQGANVSYQWVRSGILIPEATAPFYVVQPDDFGQTIGVAIFVSKPGFSTRADFSDIVNVIPKQMVQTAVTITGKSKVGSKLTAKTTAWVAGAKIAYQWLRNGKVIKGANKATYVLSAKDKKAKVSVNVTQTSKGYANSSKASAALKIK